MTNDLEVLKVQKNILSLSSYQSWIVCNWKIT